jgi:hypothetical protein
LDVSRRLELEGKMVLLVVLNEGGSRYQICTYIHMQLKLAGLLSWWAYKQLTTKRVDLSNIRPLASNPNDGNTPVTMRNHIVEDHTVIEFPRPQLEREVSAM